MQRGSCWNDFKEAKGVCYKITHGLIKKWVERGTW